MIQAHVDDQRIAFSGELLAQAVLSNMPGFITGTDKPQGMQQAAIKSGVKGLVPMLLGMLHKEIVEKGLPIPPPDLKCPAARANIVIYGVCYILANATMIAEHQVFIAEGERGGDGVFVVTGFTTTAAEAVATIGGARDTHLLTNGSKV